MYPDSLGNCVEFLSWKPPAGKKFPAPGNRIGHVIPFRELLRITWPMAEKNSEIVHPRCSEHDVVVIVNAFSDRPCQGIEPRLMAELIRWCRFGADVRNGGATPV
jgi:hypothetical protein